MLPSCFSYHVFTVKKDQFCRLPCCILYHVLRVTRITFYMENCPLASCSTMCLQRLKIDFTFLPTCLLSCVYSDRRSVSLGFPCADDLVDHVRRVAAAAPSTPMYYYHIPVRSGVNSKWTNVTEISLSTKLM